MDDNLNTLIIGFIAILIGAILIGEIADNVYGNTDLSLDNSTNVTHTWTTLVDGDDGIDPTSDVSRWVITNADWYAQWNSLALVNQTALTQGTDYTVAYNNPADTVTIQILNATGSFSIGGNGSDNITLANYQNYPQAYVQGSAISRTLLRLIPIFFAIGILSIGIWMVGKGIMGYISETH